MKGLIAVMAAVLLWDTQLTEFNLELDSVYLDSPGEYSLTGYTEENTVEIVSGCEITMERLECDVTIDTDQPVTITLRASSKLGVFQCGDSPVYVTSEDGFGSLTAQEYSGGAYFAHCLFNGESYGHFYEKTGGTTPSVLCEGENVYTCFACGDSYTQTVPRRSMDWTSAWRAPLYAALWGEGLIP